MIKYYFLWEVYYWVKIQDFFFVAGIIFGITSIIFLLNYNFIKINFFFNYNLTKIPVTLLIYYLYSRNF